jgi:hypothetical protein
MSRKKKTDTTGNLPTDNWVKVSRLDDHQRAIKTLAKVKLRDKDKKFKLVPIEGSIRAFKQVEIK